MVVVAVVVEVVAAAAVILMHPWRPCRSHHQIFCFDERQHFYPLTDSNLPL